LLIYSHEVIVIVLLWMTTHSISRSSEHRFIKEKTLLSGHL